MSRPRSPDKRAAILAAATQSVAECGLAAPTATIAKSAGVAQGSLFNYFPTKDALLNQVYVSIKEEIAAVLLVGYPDAGSPEERIRHIWFAYVRWGVENAMYRRAMLQLNVSGKITPATRMAADQTFTKFYALIQENINLESSSMGFASAVMGALAETTIDFMARDPGLAAAHAESGFRIFRRAVVAPIA